MNEYQSALDSTIGKRQDILRAVLRGTATPNQKHAYRAMQRDARRRASKWS